MSNPFLKSDAVDESPSADIPAGSPSADIPASEDPVEADSDDDSYGTFEPPAKGKPTDQKTVPLARLSKVVGERNSLRESLAERDVRLAAAEARAETLEKLQSVVTEKYRTNPDLLKFDSHFMDLFEKAAETDPMAATVANKIKSMMTGAPMIETSEVEVSDEEAATDPAVEKILVRDVSRQISETLNEHSVKPTFISAFTRDVLTHMSPVELSDATPAEIVELAKHYASETGQTAADFLLPKKGGAAKPDTTSGRQPARSAAVEAVEEAPERVKPKTLEEFEKQHNARFKALTKDLFPR